jgi:predicted amidohydrolase YtcJ
MVTGQGRIVELGTLSLMASRNVTDQVIDLEQAFVTPGFWDSHFHLLEYGRSFRQLVIDPNQSYSSVLESVHSRAARENVSGVWILGGGWNPHQWQHDPRAVDLSSVSMGHPVLLFSHDYHSAWINQEGLQLLGIGIQTPAVSGGVIERDVHGRPTGVIRENQVGWAVSHMEPPSLEDNIHDLTQGMRHAARLGIVGVTAIEQPESLFALQSITEDTFPLKVEVMLPHHTLNAMEQMGIRGGFGTNRLRIKGVKLFWDGALGSRTAWMKQPYLGDGPNRGVPVMDAETASGILGQATRLNLAVAMHAIGDEAVHQALLAVAPYVSDQVPHHRVEHAQLLSDDDLPRIQSQVALSMQPVHMIDDYPIARRYWGDRWRQAFRFGSVVRQNALLLFGSDAPIASPDVRLGLWMAVHRAPPDQPQACWPLEEKLTPRAAMEAYTRWPAVADGRRSGLIQPGYAADFTLWRYDPVEMLTQQSWENLEVLGTVVNGHLVWRHNT